MIKRKLKILLIIINIKNKKLNKNKKILML